MKFISWNVNGIRAAEKKGLFDFLSEANPDVLSLQETKAQPEQLTKKFHEQSGYTPYWASAERKGYSGVVCYSKMEPESVSTLGIEEFDSEGRSIILEFKNVALINCYFPNSQHEGKRLDYKLRFNEAVHKLCDNYVANGKHVVVCGDFNVAHKPIDLTHPKANEKTPGYLPEERAWMDQFLENGYKDSFRMFNQEPEQYSWWSYRMNARAKNVGWRLDYHCIDEAAAERITSAEIFQQVMGSDHCPVVLDGDFS
jgi:exodeoxyribonuclease-3